jgi:hypothetical protein
LRLWDLPCSSLAVRLSLQQRWLLLLLLLVLLLLLLMRPDAAAWLQVQCLEQL